MTSTRTRLAALGSAVLLPLAGLAVTSSTTAYAHDPAVEWGDFAKLTLTTEVGEPMSMAVLPDRRVLHTNRHGQFRLYDPDTAATQIITSLPVYQFSEDGMQGIALDPQFEANGWVYVYYSPQIDGFPEGPALEEIAPGEDPSVFDEWIGRNNLSRFQFVDDPVSPFLDLASEQVILEVPINRGLCCHNGGDIDFDSAGNLYLSTGDDTNPFQSDGYTPIDERLYRNPGFDAQRTSANTADLRGKLLRITVTEDGSYEVPEGNLFNSGQWDHLFPGEVYDPELALPEIYAMGFRNPFRFSVDPATDTVYLGDYGPDANQPHPDRGPRATVEWSHITEPGNHGWPYCVGPDDPFVDFDFETGESGEPFDCAAPVNDSPHNTGLTDLPPTVLADVWWHNGFVNPQFPELGPFPGGPTGSGPMGGPAYQYDPAVAEQWHTAFPEELDGIPLMYEWVRNYVMQMHLDDQGGVAHLELALPNVDWHAPMDMEFGPDGSLYILEYGGGFFVEHEDAKLARVDYVPDGRAPVARASAQPRSGESPLSVEFSSEGTHHPEEDGEIVALEWSFGDGGTSTEEHPTHTYQESGVYQATLTVTDGNDLTGRAGVTVVVGNTAPTVDLQRPVDGGFFDWGDDVSFRIRVTDPEEERIDCDEVLLNTALGHDAHAHPIGEEIGCDGSFDTPVDSGHGADMDLYWVVTARYTDQGAGDLPPLTGTDQVSLHPKRKQAQFFDDSQGVSTDDAEDPEEGGGQRVTEIDDGDWVSYQPVNLLNIDELRLRVRADGPGGTVEIRRNGPEGELLGSAEVPDTGGEWGFVSAPVSDPGHSFTLYLVFRAGEGGSGSDLFELNFFDAVGEGVAGPPPPPVCPGTIVLGVADSKVADRDAGSDRCVSELLDDGRQWSGRGAFVRYVVSVTGDLVTDEVIDHRERAALIVAAALSGIGG